MLWEGGFALPGWLSFGDSICEQSLRHGISAVKKLLLHSLPVGMARKSAPSPGWNQKFNITLSLSKPRLGWALAVLQFFSIILKTSVKGNLCFLKNWGMNRGTTHYLSSGKNPTPTFRACRESPPNTNLQSQAEWPAVTECQDPEKYYCKADLSKHFVPQVFCKHRDCGHE